MCVRQRRKTRERGEREGREGREGDLARDAGPEEDRESQCWVHLFHQFTEILTALQLHTETHRVGLTLSSVRGRQGQSTNIPLPKKELGNSCLQNLYPKNVVSQKPVV